MKASIITVLYVCLCICCSEVKTPEDQDQAGQWAYTQDSPKTGENTDVFNLPTLKILYITNQAGSILYENPSLTSAILDTLAYGDKVTVVAETKDWYQIKERVGRNYLRDGKQVALWDWEVVNILKENTGLLSQIKLTTKDLYQTSTNISLEGKTALSLTSADEFNKARSIGNTTISRRKTLVIEKDSTISVLLNNGQSSKYTSSPNAEESMRVYTYLGHLDQLGTYLLKIDYYEGVEYVLYNTITGKELNTFNDHPYLSPDGQFLVSMYTNPYDLGTDFQLFRIGNAQQINKIVEASFSNWMVCLEPQEIYWQDASTIVVKALHAKAFWNENGDLNKECQYLKIKIL